MEIILYVLIALTAIMCGIICINDVHKREIENWMNGILAGLGFLYTSFHCFVNLSDSASVPSGWNFFIQGGYLYALMPVSLSAVFFFSTFLLFARKGEDQVGGGDVKLLGACGLFLIDPTHAFWFIVSMAVFSLAMFILAKIIKKKTMPGGPVYCLPIIIAIIFGQQFQWPFAILLILAFVVLVCATFAILKAFKIVDFYKGETTD